MLSEKDITLQECLQANRLTELPAEYDPADGQLIRGISLVRKHGGTENFVSVAGDGKGGIKVTRDFGKSASIIEFIQTYAIEVLDNKRIARCRTNEDYINFLVKSNGYDEAEIDKLLENRDYETLNSLVEEVSMKNAERDEAEKKRCQEIKDYADNRKKAKRTSKSRISYAKKDKQSSND